MRELADVLASSRTANNRLAEHTERMRRLEERIDAYTRDESSHRTTIRSEIESLRGEIRRSQSSPPPALTATIDARIREILRPIEQRLEERIREDTTDIKNEIKTMGASFVELTVAMREHVAEYRTGCALRHQSLNDRIASHDGALTRLANADDAVDKELESERKSMLLEYKESRRHWSRYAVAVVLSAFVGWMTSKGCAYLTQGRGDFAPPSHSGAVSSHALATRR